MTVPRHATRPKATVVLAFALMIPIDASAGWPDIALPPTSQGEMVNGHVKYNGVEMRTSRFRATLPPDEVAAFYSRMWPRQHVLNRAAGKTILGHMEGGHFITIELQPQGVGTAGTIGIVKTPSDDSPPLLGEGFYRPADTNVLSDLQHLDTPSKTRTLVMENQLSPYVNQKRYIQRLREEGWTSMHADGCQPSSRECAVRFDNVATGRRASMTFTRDGVATSTVAIIE